MPRLREGFVFRENGKWYARFDYKDETGRKRKVRRTACPNTKAAAKELLRQLLREFEERQQQTVPAEVETFKELADYYEGKYLVPPQYVDGRKIAGLRTHYNGKLYLKLLKEFFGDRKLTAVSHRDLEDYRLKRLNTPTKQDKQRSIASVNRELELLRRMFNVAKRAKWVESNPFNEGESLISKADEKQRQRILSYEEEAKLLAACGGRRKHLRAIIIFQLDMGTRRGEAFKMRWREVDFAAGEVTIPELNSKTAKQRKVGMTDRVAGVLWELYEASDKNPDSLVFGIKSDVKRAFQAARREAGLPDVRMHDLRHTFCSRLVEAQIPAAEAARVSGHDQLSTFLPVRKRQRGHRPQGVASLRQSKEN